MEKSNKAVKLHELYKKYGLEFTGNELVYGDGNPDSGFVMVGEAPGKEEVRLGRPFVGMAGGNLKKFMDYLEWAREDIYVTNAIKYRLFKINPKNGRKSNRPARMVEIRGSMEWLNREFDILEPKLILTLGNVPLKAVTGDFKLNIGDVHGEVVETALWKVFPLYHPASLIYNRSLEDVYYEDLNKLKLFLKEIKK